MFSKIVLVYLVLINFLTYFSSGEFLERRIKRGDIDLQTCIDNFDVHKDKIIRTQDSQNMGAKYLNEIDLGSRDECLRLCCETDHCDVFVYEEKKSGSCYLFQCGPPEDFKCKFTHHVNYSSAVLAVNRHLPDLESQIKLTKHEQDLTKLRKPESEPEMIQPELLQQVQEVRTTPSTTSTTTKIKEILPNIPKNKPPESRKCSRYQFECRSSGECIAIYNACDGIPQCSDGSDEAPELDCPGLLTTSIPLPVPVQPINSAPPIRYEQTISQSARAQQQQSLIGGAGGTANTQEVYNRQIIQDTVNPQLQSIIQRQQQEQPDFIRPGADVRVGGGFNSRMQYDAPQPQQLSPYAAQVPAQPQNNWIPHQSNQMPPQLPQYADKSSHIYNHKDSGLQVPDGQDISSMQYADGANSRDYQKMQGYYPDTYRQNGPQESWPNTQQQDDNRYNNNRYGLEPRVKDWHSDMTHDVPKKTVPSSVQQPPPATFEHQPELKNANENPKHVQDKMSHELKQSKDIMDHRETSIKIEQHKSSQPDLEVTAIKLSPDFQDGIAETPSGAVLSLTLGLIITCIMAILIGCRLRVVRRRMRKGGKAYAHDADYLVNGMYL